MPDPVEPSAPAADPVVEPVTTPEVSPAVEPVVEPVVEPEVDPFDDEATDTFERAYVEKIRREAAERRTSLKPYEEAFAPFSEPEREVLMSLVRDIGNPETIGEAAQRMKDLAERILAPDEETPEPVTPEPTPEVEIPKTAEELQAFIDKYVSDRETASSTAAAEAKAQEDAVQAVIKETTDLGYEPGTREYETVLLRASQQFDGDVKAAHAAIEAEKQAVIDKFVEEAALKGAVFPKVAGGSGAPADPAGGHDKTWAGARKSMLSRIKD